MLMAVRTLEAGNRMNAEIVSAEKRIVELGIDMPPAPQPLGAYTETVQSGRLVYVTGTLPVVAGKLQYTGTLGKEIDLIDGRKAARLAALNSLAAVREHLGSLDRIVRVLKTEVYLATTDEFVAMQPRIADGASQLLLDVFGDKGLSVRKIMGVASMPLHAPVMVELLFEVDG
ncbi:Enamine deaminase RidA, house cleaning of reactive enamine intermediates, YjgF/YER057c/UK114 family [Terriglobus roseus]|uniref:Enamine deaminase RidA, house cleaning of reactive enamine intermediates, YjgF/YER057c/UK114 family n=2 Tax=Terriglobus roseus TaxID=392734 RepID=A0A1G7PVK5_9BACT|nr:Enamine deaminase RidA, house cleaning of reactive enamine intermediates, YjgF/YER057c/UK114 family [Terriglobus roseus]